MHKLLFLSDLHICSPGETIIEFDPSARAKAALDAALADHDDADAMILLGDLTHDGKIAAYRTLKTLLQNVPMPVVAMLGNHDRREAFVDIFGDAPRMASGHIQHSFDVGGTRVVTLDSLDGPPYFDRQHAGHICQERMHFLENALATRGNKQAIVCIHHPPFNTGIIGMDRIKLADGDAFLDMLASHGNLHLICGHIHRTMSGTSRGVGWSMFKSPCHQGLLDLHSPNAHLSSNEPGAYGIALLTPGNIVIHSEDVGLADRRLFGGYATED